MRQACLIHVGKHDICPLIDEMPRNRETNTICGAGDNGCLAFDGK